MAYVSPKGFAFPTHHINGKDVRHARRRSGYTQKEFAKWLGVARQTLIGIEKNANRPVRSNTLAYVIYELAHGDLSPFKQED